MACAPGDEDCLLRAILQTQETFNWNPPTFGVTLVIGILALLISLTTVFQAVLGAGPGRLKASKRAIGPVYSRRTETNFSFAELRFRTVAWVPFIDHVDHSKLPFTTDASSQDFNVKTSDSIYGAGWLNLTSIIPHGSQRWFLTPCQTDYLPVDVLATPARATIRAIVELAVLNGCDYLQTEKDFPLARGREAQLSFREHPFLGVVGVFDQYLPFVRTPTQVRKRDLLYLKGQMSFKGVFAEAFFADCGTASRLDVLSRPILQALYVRKRSQPRKQDAFLIEALSMPGRNVNIALGLLTWDSLSDCRGLPYSRTFMRNGALDIVSLTSGWNTMDVPTILLSLHHLLYFQSATMAYDLDDADSISRSCKFNRGLLGWTWLVDNEVEETRDSFVHPFTLPEGRLAHGQAARFEWQVHGEVVRCSSKLATGDGNLLILPTALDLCMAWLEDAKTFEDIAADQADNIRWTLEYQLHEVDFWLLKYGGILSADGVLQLLELLLQRPQYSSQRQTVWVEAFPDSIPKALGGIPLGNCKSYPVTFKYDRSANRIARSEDHRIRRSHSKELFLDQEQDNNVENEQIIHPDAVSMPSSPESFTGEKPFRRYLLPPKNPKRHLPPEDVPGGARWTKIKKILVNGEALKQQGIPFEEFSDYVIVFKVLTRDEIAALAELTFEIRDRRTVSPGQTNIEQLNRGQQAEAGPLAAHLQIGDTQSEDSASTPRRHSPSQSSRSSFERIRSHSSDSVTTSTHHTLSPSPKPHAISREPDPDGIGADGSLANKEKKKTADLQPMSERALKRRAEVGMQNLLVYRAVLFAALGAFAADTSCVFETEMGRRVVQML